MVCWSSPPADFQVDSDQPLHASVLLSDAAMIEMDAVIARQDSEHLGMTCINIDVESIAHLRRLVELNLGDPDAAERELGELLAHYEQQLESQ
ncbi:MAG: hypothetical protein AseanaTS_15430 [Candidatus Pelagadaptatus aseana]|uniref:hypothetical protein n=1 Tax=Candidatus Pelagadaptatus aseana TaxID=3120508 RepID=UPI0039B131D8